MKASFNRLAARYLQAEAGLGRAFLDEYEVWEKRTRRFPESCPEIAPGIRCGFLARFKYHVTTLGGAIHCVFSTCALPGRFR